MSGIRLSGRAIVPDVEGSLPYAVFTGSPDFEYNIWRVIDGVPTNLTGYVGTDAEHWKVNPMISPDGTLVAYTQQDINTFEFELWTVPANGGTPTMILGGSTEALMHAYWHPDSTHFLYTEGLIGSWGGDIRRIDADGSNDTLILAGTAGAGPNPATQFYRPQYNMDGTLIVFARRVQGAPSVFTLRVMEDDASNETSVRTLASYVQDGSQFAFANTSNRIAFWDGAATGVTGECYTVDPDGTDLVQISDPIDTLCRISKYAWMPDDSEVLGSAFIDLPSAPGVDEWRPVTMDPAGGPTMTVINDDHWGGSYTNRRQMWLFEGRLYFLEEGATNPFAVSSILPDGSDYRIDDTVTIGPEMGPEYV